MVSGPGKRTFSTHFEPVPAWRRLCFMNPRFKCAEQRKMAKVIVVRLAAVFLLVKSCETALTANQRKVFDVYKTAYYDPVANLTLKTEIEDSARLPYTRIGFRSLPCACQDLSCGCCAGINITRIKFDQKACTNFTYDPYDFSIKMQLAMNDRNILESKVSGKNPPPICIPFPYIPAVDLCIRFYNIFMPGNNLHACIDFETRVVQSPILVLHFDCVRIGADGVAWVKPEDNGGLNRPDGDYFVSPMISEPETYDAVDFEPSDSEAGVNGTNSSLSLEEEDNIGQLKF